MLGKKSVKYNWNGTFHLGTFRNFQYPPGPFNLQVSLQTVLKDRSPSTGVGMEGMCALLEAWLKEPAFLLGNSNP